jgi:nucleoside recognition membrane protein YjiH
MKKNEIRRGRATSAVAMGRFLVYSAIGTVAFFVPFTLMGRSTILLDHVVSFAIANLFDFALLVCMSFIVVGVIVPFTSGSWRKSRTSTVISIFQISSIALAVMYLFDIGPAAILQPDMLPFLVEKLAIPVGLIVPAGAFFLTFLIGFGLMEAIGTLAESIMRPIWRTPGRSAVDAVASFAGSYSVALILTNRVYKAGGYSAREAAIVATGFSTVSATFMIVVARTLDLTSVWNVYFWSTLFVTFLVTAIVVRLPPLSTFDDTKRFRPDDEIAYDYSVTPILRAWQRGVQVAQSAPPLGSMLLESVLDGLRMATRIVPAVLSIGTLGLLAAKYTPVFDIVGYLIYPVVWLSQLANPGEVSSALASGLAEMFLPAIQATEMPGNVRFTIAVVSVSSVLFFSGSIPCVLATEIPITIGQMAIIWFERTTISVPLAAALAHFVMPS